jgi:hypothetical protein
VVFGRLYLSVFVLLYWRTWSFHAAAPFASVFVLLYGRFVSICTFVLANLELPRK